MYGLAQSALLPTDEYRWLTAKQISKLDWKSINTESDTGYIVECDLSYPEHLHYKHDSFILAPEQKTITYDDLSPYSKSKSHFPFWILLLCIMALYQCHGMKQG